ncbi:hypothetical protein C2G38_1017570 [Gigaspora rosea]|uniref:Uncharacterized protein n=1 Tax=Gigaspora rosea TaxID=44941 RepID=A0A397VLL6_9GLOM|nr:hypothetical protein C2G38_1017570 [Gigaspora rosea]
MIVSDQEDSDKLGMMDDTFRKLQIEATDLLETVSYDKMMVKILLICTGRSVKGLLLLKMKRIGRNVRKWLLKRGMRMKVSLVMKQFWNCISDKQYYGEWH